MVDRGLISEFEWSLSSQEGPVWFPVGASLWAPKLGYSCQLCFNPSLLPRVQPRTGTRRLGRKGWTIPIPSDNYIRRAYSLHKSEALRSKT
jgi:hypothetical protein